MKGGEEAQLLLLTIITHNAAAEGRLSAEWADTPVASRCVQGRRADALSENVWIRDYTYHLTDHSDTGNNPLVLILRFLLSSFF